MRLGLTLLGLFLSCAISAQDSDTIPLANRTNPTAKGDRTESKLLIPGQSNPKESAPKKSVVVEGSTHPTDRPYIASVDVFGSPRINSVVLKNTLGADLENWFKRGLAADPASTDLEHKLASKMKTKFDLPFAEWSVVQYFEPGDLAIHVTLDVVEKSDFARRMPFLPEPTQTITDPSNLVKTWMDYEDTALDLVEKGIIEPGVEECPAFHCPFGHKHASLKKYEKIFVEGVNKNEKALTQILTSDKRGDYRASAAYLLAYLKDGKKLISLMVDRIKDPDDLVRNNAMRVLGDIAEAHPDLIVPVKPVLEALHYPRVSDRSKALYVTYVLAMNSEQARDEIMRTALPELLLLVDTQQPDQRDVAHVVLKKVSGKDFAVNDVRSWTRWVDKMVSDRQITKK